MTSIGTPYAGNDSGKISDGPTPSLPHANSASPLVQNKLYCKLLTAKRVLVINLKHPKTNWNGLKTMTLSILRQSSKKLKNPSRIIKLALMIIYATQRLKRNYLVMWKTCLIGVCNRMTTL